MSLLELFKRTKINIGLAVIESDTAVMLDYEFEITPKSFLNFSKQDFKAKDKRGNINALTNAKRAIDCQTDKVLSCFGFSIARQLPEANNKYIKTINPELSKTGIPHKLKLLQALDIAPANIITNTRAIRNKLEHYYEQCSDNDVENAIQLADLFINATDSKLKMVWNYRVSDNKNGESESGGCIDVNFDNEGKKIYVRGYHAGFTQKLIFAQNDVEFYPLLKLSYSFQYTSDLEDHFKELMLIINHPIPTENIHLEVI